MIGVKRDGRLWLVVETIDGREVRLAQYIKRENAEAKAKQLRQKWGIAG